ncbi:MAG: hypothetical protein OIF47_12305 [Marinibacterium sp.]|nr:hypothetical protein [Marinibacterium sp.]
MARIWIYGAALVLSASAVWADTQALPLGPGPVVDVPGQPVTDIGSTALGAAAQKDPCGADQYLHLLGAPYGQVGTQLPIGVQVQQQGAPFVNAEKDPKRLNVELNDDEAISRIWCG